MDTLYVPNLFDFIETFTVNTWENVIRMIKGEVYTALVNKMIRDLPFNFSEWSRTYIVIEQYFAKEKVIMSNESKKLCDEIIQYFKENNIPEQDWLAIINQTDREVRHLALNTPISKLRDIAKENKD